MSALVIIEIQHDALNQASKHAICAASQLGVDIDALVIGEAVEAVAKEVASLKGVKTVHVADSPNFKHHLAEAVAPVIAELSASYNYVIAASTTFSKNCMPRVAAVKDVMLISDVTKIIDANTFERPIYAGNAIATVQSNDALKLLTIRATAFDTVESADTQAEIQALDLDFTANGVAFVSAEIPELERPELTSARVVVSGGRGLQSKENFAMIERLADKLNAAIGASRAAVDAGFVPNDYQVGQTGKIVAPELYIAVGISGAIQHIAGMKDSKIIVAINKDADAPIFQIADYGIAGDLFEILPELEKRIN